MASICSEIMKQPATTVCAKNCSKKYPVTLLDSFDCNLLGPKKVGLCVRTSKRTHRADVEKLARKDS